MIDRVRIGLVDGAVLGEPARAVVKTRHFHGTDGPGEMHGSLVAQCVLAHCDGAELIVAQVFDGRRVAPVAAVVDALDWLLDCGVAVVNMSFGMTRESPAMTAVCRRAAERGVVLAAAAPSHGPTAYPAAIDECIAVTGDARCRCGEIALLNAGGRDFGTHPLVRSGEPRAGGGASIATARMSGLIGARMRAGISAAEMRATLVREAVHIGPDLRHG